MKMIGGSSSSWFFACCFASAIIQQNAFRSCLFHLGFSSPNRASTKTELIWYARQDWTDSVDGHCRITFILQKKRLIVTIITMNSSKLASKLATAVSRPSIRSMSSTANVWIDKNTRVICQGFTGKQVRIESGVFQNTESLVGKHLVALWLE